MYERTLWENQGINLSQLASIQTQCNEFLMDSYKVIHLNSNNKFHRYKLKENFLGKSLMILIDHKFNIIQKSIIRFKKNNATLTVIIRKNKVQIREIDTTIVIWSCKYCGHLYITF